MKDKYYHFDLVLAGNDAPSNEIEDALFEAGCDDASVFYQNRTMYLMFAREAPTEIDAIASAIRDVKAAGHGLSVVAVLYDQDEEKQSAATKKEETGRYMIKVDVADKGKVFITRKEVGKDKTGQQLLNSLKISKAQLKAMNAVPELDTQLAEAVEYLYTNKELRKRDSFLMYLHYQAA